MSRRRFPDSIQFRAASQGRAQVAHPALNWSNEPNWRVGGAWVCRNAEGQFLAAVYVTGTSLLAVGSPDLSSTESHSVPGHWPVNPIGLRAAKVAAEAFVAGHGAAVLAEAA